MNSSDFQDWKRHPVTQAIFSQLDERVNVLTEEIISQTAYMSQSEMAEKAGAIKAIRDLITISFDETSGV